MIDQPSSGGAERSDQSRRQSSSPKPPSFGTAGGMDQKTAEDDKAKPETSLADDIASLKETVAGLVASIGSEATKSVKAASDAVTTQISNVASGALDAGASAASFAGDQAKTMANELEAFARRNPLGALGGTLVLGILIGMIARNRS
jgi:ElaB/YqjD/DUF883 family membrane-anchored ribosome-binding protein